jgi:CRISPR-associated protein Csx14
MNDPKPNIQITVDLTNPGQFFACCGLLELADRLWPGREVAGNFTAPRFSRSIFSIFATSSFGVGNIVTKLLECSRTSVEPYQPIKASDGKLVADAKKTRPVFLGSPVSIRLSWWLDELAGVQTEFKTWGAHNTSEGLISDMANVISVDGLTDNTILQSSIGMTSRLGLDTRSSWNTLDAGFSPNDQNLPVDTYPATELLAAIGLETFRPAPARNGYVYTCWPSQTPAVVARAVASGNVDIPGTTRYRFEIGARGKFKFFTRASSLERSDHA